MGWISGFVVATIVGLVLAALNRGTRKAEVNMGANRFTITVPKMYATIGIGAMIIMTGFTIVIPLVSEDTNMIWIFYVVMSIFMLGCLFLVVYSSRWKMVVIDGKIIITPMFGKDRILNIWDIARIRIFSNYSTTGIKAFDATGKKLFRVDSDVSGYYPFMQMIERMRPELFRR